MKSVLLMYYQCKYSVFCADYCTVLSCISFKYTHVHVITDDVSAEVLRKFKVEVDNCGGTPVLLKKLLKYDKREIGTVTHHEFKRCSLQIVQWYNYLFNH
jgi:hypothetical protein